ncbi:hypothetical protein KSP40_PGU004293 [Platanthera guangdongensis]|uniref:Uncharacterized protein n=1 Tax=Platanthera guangdongensis TaxID=2320717 RepID=A0ABR2MK72_9ASPA
MRGLHEEKSRLYLGISEAMDTWTKKGLQNFVLHSMPNRADVPHIFLELLSTLSRSDFPNERFYMQWLRRQEWVDLPQEVRSDTLDWIGKFISRMSSMPEKNGVSNANYYWAGNYFFTVRLYEKLLSSVFDILEDGHIVEEAEEILGVLRMSWSMLGITQLMHDTLYGWALFQQVYLFL